MVDSAYFVKTLLRAFTGSGADMEDRDKEKGSTCEHGEDKDYGVWH